VREDQGASWFDENEKIESENAQIKKYRTFCFNSTRLTFIYNENTLIETIV